MEIKYNPPFVIVFIFIFLAYNGLGIYIDQGVPYKQGQLHVGELTISKEEKSPMHVKAWYPLEEGTYPVIYFVGGLGGLVLSEFYSTVLSRIASHGFVVFGVDPYFPVMHKGNNVFKEPKLKRLKADVDKYFQEYHWLQKFMVNKVTATILWNTTGLLCHSAGCDDTLRMTIANSTLFKSTIFLEPASNHVNVKVNNTMPALMYGTQLSEEGLVKCAVPGMDYNKFYDIWTCPKIVMNVANFGHCDILDPLPWQACHDTKFCKTTNDSHLDEYRMFAQGVVSAFFVTTLQGGSDTSYITDKTKIPLPLLELKTDLNCSSMVLK